MSRFLASLYPFDCPQRGCDSRSGTVPVLTIPCLQVGRCCVAHIVRLRITQLATFGPAEHGLLAHVRCVWGEFASPDGQPIRSRLSDTSGTLTVHVIDWFNSSMPNTAPSSGVHDQLTTDSCEMMVRVELAVIDQFTTPDWLPPCFFAVLMYVHGITLCSGTRVPQ